MEKHIRIYVQNKMISNFLFTDNRLTLQIQDNHLIQIGFNARAKLI